MANRDYSVEPRIGTSWRNGKDRISYRPDWSPTQPFVTYSNGTAGKHFVSLRQAQIYLGGAHWEVTP